MKKLLMLSLLVSPSLAIAEYDGEELLGMMEKPAGREIALAQIDDVRAKWDGSVFCIARSNPHAPDNAQNAAFTAVKTYLEAHAEERYRPRRYLIIQGLRDAYPCTPQ